MGDTPQWSNQFQEDSQTIDIVADTVSSILDIVHEESEKKRMESLAVPLATDVAMVKLRRLMAWAVLNHDGVVQEGTALEYMQPDEEPKALIIDPWARGMVPSKQVRPEDTGAMYRTLGGELGEGILSPRSATGSRVSSNTGTSRSGTSRGGTRTARSGASTRAGTAAGRLDEDDDPTGQIFDLEDEYDKNAYVNPGNMSLEQLLKKQTKADDNTEEVAEVKTEFEVMQENIEQQVKDLKGKKYTIDRNGQVVQLTTVKPTSLPPYQVNPETKIANYKEKARAGSRGRTAGTAASNADSMQGETGTAAESKKGKRKIRVAGSRAVDEYTFLPSYTLADTLSSTAEQVVPTAGVSVQINDSTRTGPSVPSIPGKMSRKEYAARNVSQTGGEDLGGSMDEGTFDGGSSLLQTGEQAFNDSQVPLSMQGGSNMRQELQYKLPDVDAMAGGRRIVQPDHVESPTAGRDADIEDGLGPVSNAGGGDIILAKIPGPKDPNVRLFSHDTTFTGKPKDRDLPSNMKPPSERVKPVAPPPGQVSIYDSPDKFAMARMAQGLPPKGSPSGLSQGSDQPSPNSRGTSKSKSKVGQTRVKNQGLVKNEKPHMSAQIF